MKTFFHPGHELEFIAGSAVVSGDLITAGSLVGVAAGSYASGETGVMEISGVHKLLKVTSQVWTQGQPVYRVPGGNTVSNISTSNLFMGYAAQAALSSDVVGQVLLARPGS